MRLVDQTVPNFSGRNHFFGIATRLMRQILVDHARSHRSLKRGGGAISVILDNTPVVAPGPGADVIALNDALDAVEKIDPRKVAIMLVVHRDLKLSNILVDAEGTPKLLDFGIAKLLDSTEGESPTLTSPGNRILTPQYASPEQVSGEPITTASEIQRLLAVAHHRVGYLQLGAQDSSDTVMGHYDRAFGNTGAVEP